MSTLESLKQFTTIVADTGDIDLIRTLSPQDATTNPSLMLQACNKPQYDHIVNHCITEAISKYSTEAEQVEFAMDLLLMTFGKLILEIVPGYVSSEVDARLSFDTKATIARAERLIDLYETNGVSRERVLIKIASTWEGIKAAEVLEKKGIRCNLTLLFSQAQARSCAEANVTLISPFVGRILDYWKAKGKVYETASEDPGVQFVSQVWSFYKKYGYNTIVMGASFRNAEEIIELAGCDRLTISPALLNQLQERQGAIPLKLDASKIEKEDKLPALTEAEFRWAHNKDAMAREKLGDGIVAFAQDIEKLETLIKAKIEDKKKQ